MSMFDEIDVQFLGSSELCAICDKDAERQRPSICVNTAACRANAEVVNLVFPGLIRRRLESRTTSRPKTFAHCHARGHEVLARTATSAEL